MEIELSVSYNTMITSAAEQVPVKANNSNGRVRSFSGDRLKPFEHWRMNKERIPKYRPLDSGREPQSDLR